MIKQVLNNIIKTLLICSFIWYYASITLFPHVHQINGITVVHSHFYKSDKNNLPIHKHSLKEITLISIVSAFSGLQLFLETSLLILLVTSIFLLKDKLLFHYLKPIFANLQLRAPPVMA